MMENARIYSNQELAGLCPGLSLVEDFITEEEELAMCCELDAKPWDNRLSRRVQHYGFEFDYASRMAVSNGSTNSCNFPPQCYRTVEQRLLESTGICPKQFDQLTVNEYLPGQGIAPHVDSHSCFGNVMLSLSLIADICIRFVPKSTKLSAVGRVNLWLPRRSLLVMQGPSRLAFTHCIPARSSDLVNGVVIKRQDRRVSLTFRSVRFPAQCNCEFSDSCEVQDLVLTATRIAPRNHH
ncbi:hypothetical protein BASA81_006851 [Batrachochytrium salamandrivorans]|nr:hypothetical protein BASA81_006851 [Batrachochytrium salamandrivorans]